MTRPNAIALAIAILLSLVTAANIGTAWMISRTNADALERIARQQERHRAEVAAIQAETQRVADRLDGFRNWFEGEVKP